VLFPSQEPNCKKLKLTRATCISAGNVNVLYGCRDFENFPKYFVANNVELETVVALRQPEAEPDSKFSEVTREQKGKVGEEVGMSVGKAVGDDVGASVGDAVGMSVG
jgi:hypothetical protein